MRETLLILKEVFNVEYFLFFISLGFFIFIIWMVQIAEERMYQRKLNEQREFGYRKDKYLLRKELDKL
jgi:hypothetical protein